VKGTHAARAALQFIVVLGVANFFADFTYEGARGIIGPFLASLGASASVVGFVAGFGELVGYSLRSVTGYVADRTRKYWLVTFSGYFINMLAVPALALAGNWPIAAGLMVAERSGRAIRKPAVDTMISDAGRTHRIRLGIWIERSARSSGRDARPARGGVGAVSQRELPDWLRSSAHFRAALFEHRRCRAARSCPRHPNRQIAVQCMANASFI